MTENNILIDESIDVGEYIEFDELLHVVSQIKNTDKSAKDFQLSCDTRHGKGIILVEYNRSETEREKKERLRNELNMKSVEELRERNLLRELKKKYES